MSDFNAQEMLTRNMSRRLTNTAEELASRARHLASDMTQLAERMERIVAGEDEHRPNSLGEVQTQGANIDRLCAVYAEREEQMEELVSMIAEMDQAEK